MKNILTPCQSRIIILTRCQFKLKRKELSMSRGSQELVNSRKEEIISACAELYKTKSFKEITIKEIGKATSFTRTSIYNYFQTKEEIFLALLQKEYERWIAELDEIIRKNERLTREELASALAYSLENRRQLLKLMSMNHFDMEMNSRPDNLAEFKVAYGNSIKAVKRCLDKFCSGMSEREKEDFLYAYFPFIYGIYPYAIVTDEQKEAMERAQVNYVYHSIYELAFNCVKKLLITK